MTYRSSGRPLSVIALVLIVFAFGCRGPREMTPAIRPLSTAHSAMIELHSNQAEFDWFSSRFTGSVEYNDKMHTIAGTMRIRKDSAIFISIAPVLGIEVARALITPDSVKLLNRIESTYYLGDIGILNNMFNTDIDFFMLQSLLTGNDFPHFRMDQFDLTQETPLLRLVARERLRDSGSGQAIQQAITVDPETMRIRTNILEENQSGRALRADYERYESVGGTLLPAGLKIMFADPSGTSNLEMNYTRMALNIPQKMQFKIPSKYTRIKLAD